MTENEAQVSPAIAPTFQVRRAIALKPDGARSYNGLGNALSALRDFLISGEKEYLDKYRDYYQFHQQRVAELKQQEANFTEAQKGIWSLFEEMLSRRTAAGFLSEDIEPETGELWGNYPQTYSLAGLINCALLLSRPWSAVR